MKNLDLTYAYLAQQKNPIARRNRNAANYSASIKTRRKAKQKSSLGSLLSAALVTAACVSTFAWVAVDAFELVPTEQEYIVRYGTTHASTNGNLLITTQDGNQWELQDGPLYDDNTEVRVLFDSKGTEAAEDDTVIDITRR